MRRPDEIKKGLECCVGPFSENACMRCPYNACDKCSWQLEIDALAYIRQLEAQVPKWISVTDDLPKSKYKKYEVWLANACVADVAEYYGDGEWMYPNCYNITRFVTHWKEMPEGPKEG